MARRFALSFHLLKSRVASRADWRKVGLFVGKVGSVRESDDMVDLRSWARDARMRIERIATQWMQLALEQRCGTPLG